MQYTEEPQRSHSVPPGRGPCARLPDAAAAERSAYVVEVLLLAAAQPSHARRLRPLLALAARGVPAHHHAPVAVRHVGHALAEAQLGACARAQDAVGRGSAPGRRGPAHVRVPRHLSALRSRARQSEAGHRRSHVQGCTPAIGLYGPLVALRLPSCAHTHGPAHNNTTNKSLPAEDVLAGPLSAAVAAARLAAASSSFRRSRKRAASA
jgi:hypothetical protein